MMGTSIREIEDNYFRWLQRTDEQLPETLMRMRGLEPPRGSWWGGVLW
jgi:hypothetical protein